MTRLHRALPALLLVAAAPAAAGWLVTHDGEAIRTVGEWRLDGALVVFTDQEGRLSSIRAREVDLASSRARSARPEVDPAGTPTVRPTSAERTATPVFVLTDADVSHVRPGQGRTQHAADTDDGESADPSQDGATAAPPAGSVVEVVDWRDRVDVERNLLEVSGSVVNRGPGVATSTRVEVRLVDGSGEILERRRATLREPVMQPGAVVPFTATFAGSPGFVTVEFDVTNRGFKLRPADSSAASLPADQ